jgi:hypothetical protein
MARQKCVMSAMVQQLSPQTVITKFGDLAKASEGLIETNLPASELDTFAQLALKARSQKISTVSFVPPAINTADPDIDKIHSMITQAIDRSQGSGDSGSGDSGSGGSGSGGQGSAHGVGKGFAAKRGGATTGGSIGSMSTGYAANESSDLSKVC